MMRDKSDKIKSNVITRYIYRAS